MFARGAQSSRQRQGRRRHQWETRDIKVKNQGIIECCCTSVRGEIKPQGLDRRRTWNLSHSPNCPALLLHRCSLLCTRDLPHPNTRPLFCLDPNLVLLACLCRSQQQKRCMIPCCRLLHYYYCSPSPSPSHTHTPAHVPPPVQTTSCTLDTSRSLTLPLSLSRVILPPSSI